MKLLALILLCAAASFAGTVTCVNGGADAGNIQTQLSGGGVVTIAGTCAIGGTTLTFGSGVTVQGSGSNGNTSGHGAISNTVINYTGGGYALQSSGNNNVVQGLTLNGGGLNLNKNSGMTGQNGWTITNNTIQNITGSGTGHPMHAIYANNIIGMGAHSTISNNQVTNIWPGGYPTNVDQDTEYYGNQVIIAAGLYFSHGVDNTLVDNNFFDKVWYDCIKGFMNGFECPGSTGCSPNNLFFYVPTNVVISNNTMTLSRRMGIEVQGISESGLVVKGNYVHLFTNPATNSFGYSLMFGGVNNTNMQYINNTSLFDTSPCASGGLHYIAIGFENAINGGVVQGNVVGSASNAVASCGPPGLYGRQGWSQFFASCCTKSGGVTKFQNNRLVGPGATAGYGAPYPTSTQDWTYENQALPRVDTNGTYVYQYNYQTTTAPAPGTNIATAFTSADNQIFGSGGNGTWTASVNSTLSIRNVSFFLDSTPSPIVLQELSDVTTTFGSDQLWRYHALINTSALTAGSHTIKAIATDVSGATSSSSTQHFTVGAATCAITTTSPMAAGATSISYSQTLAQNACASSPWAVSVGTLPTGLTLAPSTGVISGTPSAPGTSTFTVTYGTATPVSLSITVITSPSCSITTPSPLPAAMAGDAYTQTLAESSCTGSWSVISGVLPMGLTLNSSTGVLSGTPIFTGVYGFTVGYGAGLAPLNLTVQTPGAALYDNGNIGAFQSSSVSATIPVTLGSTPTVGNLFFAASSYTQASVATAPDGFWTAIDTSTSGPNSLSAATWWRTVRSGDTTGPYTWPVSLAANWVSGAMIEIVGANTTTPINAHQAAYVTTVSSTIAAPTVTPTINGTLGVVSITTGWGSTVAESISSVPAGWDLTAQAVSQYRSTFVFTQHAPSAGTSPVSFSANLSTPDVAIISMTLIAPAAPTPFTVSCSPIPLSGGTSTCNASQSVTWSVVGGPGTVSPSSGISTTYTQALGVAALSQVGGCMTNPNDSVYNTDISGTALSPNSAAYIANSSHIYPITFGAAWGVNIVDNTWPSSPKQFHYTPNYNTANGFAWNPLNGPAIVESGSMPGFTGSDGSDHHQVTLNHQTCQFQEFYQNNNWNGDGAPSENARSGWQYSGFGYALPTNGTTDASGQCLQCITLTGPEVLNHKVSHALRFTTNQGYMDSGKTVWPATGGSGLAGTTLAPYGSRFRLKSSFSTAGFSAEAVAILNALKTQGMIPSDAAGYPAINQIQVSPNCANSVLCAAALAQITAAAIPITQFDVVDDSLIIGPLGAAFSQVSAAAAGSNVAVIRAVSSGGGGGGGGAPSPPALVNPQNPVTYGADATGVSDSASAFQSAINAGDLDVPAGDYLINTQVTVPSNRNIRCEAGSDLRYTSTANNFYMLLWDGTMNGSVFNCHFRGPNYNLTTGKSFLSVNQKFLQFWSTSGSTGGGTVVASNDFNGVGGFVGAIHIYSTGSQPAPSNLLITYNSFEDCGHYAVQLTAGVNNTISHNTLYDCNGMVESDNTSQQMSGNLVDSNHSTYVYGTGYAQANSQNYYFNYFTCGESCSGGSCNFNGNTCSNNIVDGAETSGLRVTAAGSGNNAVYVNNTCTGGCGVH